MFSNPSSPRVLESNYPMRGKHTKSARLFLHQPALEDADDSGRATLEEMEDAFRRCLSPGISATLLVLGQMLISRKSASEHAILKIAYVPTIPNIDISAFRLQYSESISGTAFHLDDDIMLEVVSESWETQETVATNCSGYLGFWMLRVGSILTFWLNWSQSQICVVQSSFVVSRSNQHSCEFNPYLSIFDLSMVKSLVSFLDHRSNSQSVLLKSQWFFV